MRDELLGRELVDLDIAVPRSAAGGPRLREALAAARRSRSRSGTAPGGSRSTDGRTVDFTPLPGSIEDDLATRDFTINAIARPLAGGEPVDPFGGRADLEARRLRAVGESVFRDDPLRLLRAVRLEDELELRLDEETERLVQRDAELVHAAGRRADRRRAAAALGRRLPAARRARPARAARRPRSTTGSTAGTRPTTASWRSSATTLRRLPVSNELRRFAAALAAGRAARADAALDPPLPPRDRAVGARGARLRSAPRSSRPRSSEARADEPAEPLLRGDELDLPPGPEIGRLLAEIEEERAAGTIATREEALDYARRHAGAVREDG